MTRIDVAYTRALAPLEADVTIVIDALGEAPRAIASLESGGGPVACGGGVAACVPSNENGLVWLGCLNNARPLAATVARSVGGDTLVAIVCVGADGAYCIGDAYCAGVVIRLLLEEITGAVVLTDAAGAATTLAATYPDDLSALSSSARGRSMDDDRVAACAGRDMVGIVPRLERRGTVVVAVTPAS